MAAFAMVSIYSPSPIRHFLTLSSQYTLFLAHTKGGVVGAQKVVDVKTISSVVAMNSSTVANFSW